MPEYPIIPKVGERIKRQLSKLNLIPEIDPIDFVKKKKRQRHRYYSSCRDSKNREISFYARIHDNEDAKGKMVREITFLREIKKNKKLRINKYIPEFIDGEIRNNFEWFTREYAKGMSLGKTYSLKKKLSVKHVPFFINILTEIREVPFNSAMNGNKFCLSENGSYEQYLSLLRVCRKLLREKIISNQQCREISHFVYQNKGLINSQKKVVVHGDLHPGNIIMNGEQWIVDWESVRLDNFTYDIVFLWIHLWDADPKFRQKLVEDFSKKVSSFAVFEKLFRLTVFYILIKEIYFLAKITKTETTKKRYQFFRKLLRNILKDFESTLKT